MRINIFKFTKRTAKRRLQNRLWLSPPGIYCRRHGPATHTDPPADGCRARVQFQKSWAWWIPVSLPRLRAEQCAAGIRFSSFVLLHVHPRRVTSGPRSITFVLRVGGSRCIKTPGCSLWFAKILWCNDGSSVKMMRLWQTCFYMVCLKANLFKERLPDGRNFEELSRYFKRCPESRLYIKSAFSIENYVITTH